MSLLCHNSTTQFDLSGAVSQVLGSWIFEFEESLPQLNHIKPYARLPLSAFLSQLHSRRLPKLASLNPENINNGCHRLFPRVQGQRRSPRHLFLRPIPLPGLSPIQPSNEGRSKNVRYQSSLHPNQLHSGSDVPSITPREPSGWAQEEILYKPSIGTERHHDASVHSSHLVSQQHFLQEQ